MSEIVSFNPYQAPSVTESMVSARNNFPEIPTKELKTLRNDSHSIRAVAVLLMLGLLINGLLLATALISYMLTQHSRLSAGFLPIAALMSGWFLVLAIGLITRPTWARIIGFISGAVMLLAFPIGTLIGVLFLVSLARSARLFGNERIIHKELEAEWKYRRKNKVD